MPSRCRNAKRSRKCPRVTIPRHCIDSLHIPFLYPHRCSPTCHNPFTHVHHHFGACNARCMASEHKNSKCASCFDDSDSDNDTKEDDENVDVIQCPYSSSTAPATERPNEDSRNGRSYETCCGRDVSTRLQNHKWAQPEVAPSGSTAHISDNIGNEQHPCDQSGVVCSKRLALNKKNDGRDLQLSNVQPLQGNYSAEEQRLNPQLDSQYGMSDAQQHPPGTCCTDIPCSTVTKVSELMNQSIPDSTKAMSQQNVQQHSKKWSAQGLINQSIPQCINDNNLISDTRNITQDHIPSSTCSSQNISEDNPDILRCCANAYSRHKPVVSPSLPTKGISSASRPGFVIKTEAQESTAEVTPAQCMTSASGCVHGITSIMPDIQNAKTAGQLIKSRPSTCSCKGSKNKSVRKKKVLKQEASTNACDSAKCLANQNQDCPCKYPPGYSEFSCAGNIAGNCKCKGPFQ